MKSNKHETENQFEHFDFEPLTCDICASEDVYVRSDHIIYCQPCFDKEEKSNAKKTKR